MAFYSVWKEDSQTFKTAQILQTGAGLFPKQNIVLWDFSYVVTSQMPIKADQS